MNPLLRLKLSHIKRQMLGVFLRKPKINSSNIVIGKNVVFGKNVRINAKKVIIGDGCVIQDNVIINGDRFEIGDYGTIYHDCFFPGGEVKIGHNFWLGTSSIIDGRAGTVIGDNVGIGAHSQLWTHMIYGDMMQGCRFHSENSLEIGNDVWLAGHNLVSPVKIGDRSLAMLGSLITKDMIQDKTYAGNPAKDITDKIGTQFSEVTEQYKKEVLEKKLEEFFSNLKMSNYEKFVTIQLNGNDEFNDSDLIQINITNRSYKKMNSILEYNLMRFLLPDIKLLPR